MHLFGSDTTDNCNYPYLFHHHLDTMAIELDRNGVPIYDGSPETYDEWKDRSWDLFWARSGNDSLQIATPVAQGRTSRLGL